MKRVMLIVLLLVVVTSLFVGCEQDAAVDQDQDNEATLRDDIVIGLRAEPIGTIPQLTNDGFSSQVINQIYSSLTTIDDNGKIVGDIATDWEISEDNLTYTFYLRDDVYFHNGDLLTSEDVVFSYEMGMDAVEVSDIYGSMESVEAEDEFTVKVNLAYVYAPMLEKLSKENSSGIVNKSVFEEIGREAYTENPIGTGPYTLSSWEPGVRIVLERYEDYYKGPASIKTATLRFIPDPTTATIALESGEIDFTYNVSLVDLANLDENEVKVHEHPSTHFNWLAINTSVEPFNNAKVRRAIEHAINKENVVLAAMEGRATIAESIAFEGILGYNPEIGGNEYNPDLAKSLLEEAGYGDGFETSILAIGGFTTAIAEVVQDNLNQIGINVEIMNMESSAFLQDILSGNFELSYLGSDSLTYDPEQIYQRLHPDGAYSVSLYNDEEMNQYLEQIIFETDEEIRASAVEQVQIMFKESVPLIPLFWANSISISDAELNNADLMNRKLDIYKLNWSE